MLWDDVLMVLRRVAPEGLAEPWDKVGVFLGRDAPESAPEVAPVSAPQDAFGAEAGGAAGVSRALLCVDLTPEVADEAVAVGAELVVAYHPPMFEALHRLEAGPGGSWKHRALRTLIRHNVGGYSPHTALDAARGGVTDWLCDAIGPGTSVPLRPTPTTRDEVKVVVFVPGGEAEKVREAMSAAGAGWIGNYRECSFHVAGEGGFRALEGANPTIGEVGRRETVAELRLEMICPRRYLADVVRAIHASHSYEEPAYDVFEQAAIPAAADEATGAGRLLTLDAPMTRAELWTKLKAALGIGHAFAAGLDVDGAVRTAAVCPGAGGSLFAETGVEADAYVTGEMRHHDALDLRERGKLVVLPGHTQTERPYLPAYRERLVAAGGGGVAWRISEADAAAAVAAAE